MFTRSSLGSTGTGVQHSGVLVKDMQAALAQAAASVRPQARVPNHPGARLPASRTAEHGKSLLDSFGPAAVA